VGDAVVVDTDGLLALGRRLSGTAAEVAAMGAALRAVAVHPDLLRALTVAPLSGARAACTVTTAAGPAGLTGAALAAAALAAEVLDQWAAVRAAQAGAAALGCVRSALAVAPVVADRAAAPAAGLLLRGADALLPAVSVAALWVPEGPGTATEVRRAAPAALPPPSMSPTAVAAWFARLGTLRAGEVEVVPVVGPDGTTRWVVLLRGIDTGLGPTVHTLPQAVRSSRLRDDAYTRSVRLALLKAGVPPGAELMLLGHSQGGIAARSLAADPATNGPAGRYRVTCVVTAGSPVGNKPPVPAAGTRVLAIENDADPVPELDGRQDRDGPGLAVHRYTRNQGLLGRGSVPMPNHVLGTGYLPYLADPGGAFAADPRVASFVAAARPFLGGRPDASGARLFACEQGPLRDGSPGSALRPRRGRHRRPPEGLAEAAPWGA